MKVPIINTKISIDEPYFNQDFDTVEANMICQNNKDDSDINEEIKYGL